MVANFFSVDFQTLSAEERSLLSEVAREGARTRRELASATGHPEDAVEVPLYGLTMLGYLTRDGEAYRLGNWLFERWMRRRL
jgi:DNA-binding IclR family transcriptional regulator